MQLETITAVLRPRTEWEAVDMGFAMIRRDFWTVWLAWLLTMLPMTAVLVWLLWDSYPMLMMMIFWWGKSAGSRIVLYVISRRLFGENPSWRSILLEIPKAWTRRFFYRFLWARFSPWQPVTMPVGELEGLRGKNYQSRVRQLLMRGESTAFTLYSLAELLSVWIAFALLGLAIMLIPEGQLNWREIWVENYDPSTPFTIPLPILQGIALAMMISFSLTDIFLSGAGFGVYLNNRTWLEGWDVELAFRKMNGRLAKGIGFCLVCLFVFGAPTVQAEDQRTASEVIAEVKSHPDFKVHKVVQRVPISNQDEKPKKSHAWVKFLAQYADLLKGILLVLAIGLAVWLIWKFRHLLQRPIALDSTASHATSGQHLTIMGMDTNRASLPDNIPAAAWTFWSQGNHHAALALLYRGAISRIIEQTHAEIRESDTEGDCVRRANDIGAEAHPQFFQNLTEKWIAFAYADQLPDETSIRSMCEQWPYEKSSEKRRRL
ncbi:MAG: hypothetical protein EAZ42_05335 [Verrucomicrobia bacterium]|nr:MAG: hypothetical protein EAZ42_05335 [Verrucomicrobiota bacterium]